MRFHLNTIVALILSVLVGVQLFLGCSISILILCTLTIGLSLGMAARWRYDLYAILSLVVGVRYVIFPLVMKTWYGQALDENLSYPFEAYLLTAAIVSLDVSVFWIVRVNDRGTSYINLDVESEDLFSVRNLAFAIGVLSYLIYILSKPTSASVSSSGSLVILAVLNRFLVLGLIIQTAKGALSYGRRGFITLGLLIGLLFQFIAATIINSRGTLAAAVAGIALMALYCRAVRLRHIIGGMVFLAFFGAVVSPVALYLRTQRENVPTAQFAALALTTVVQALTSPSYLESINDYNASARGAPKEEQTFGYDYYRLKSQSNVLNRLSFVALVDWAYVGFADRQPLGWRVLEDGLERIVPSFLWSDKPAKSYGSGDYIAWSTGQYPVGRAAFLNYTLAMEGFASFGWIGLLVYPLVFLLPLLFTLSKIASFRRASPLSVFLLAICQTAIIESMSDGVVAELTRSIPCMFFVLYFLKSQASHVRGRVEG